MAAPTPGNMENCDPKCKCPGGPYKDQAYLCSDPCAGQGDNCTFDCQNGCTCEPSEPVKSRWTRPEIVISWFGCGYNCNPFNQNCGGGTYCVTERFGSTAALDFITPMAGPAPHEIVFVDPDNQDTVLGGYGCVYRNQCFEGDDCYPSPCSTGSSSVYLRVRDADGNWLGDPQIVGSVAGTICIGSGWDTQCTTLATLEEYISL